MDGDLIDAAIRPFLDKLPMVSDERDIDEPDIDEEVVFKAPIVGGSASLFSQGKLRSHLMNKIHAVEFKLDGSGGVINILDTDVTRDPSKLELRKETTTQTEDGPVILRRYDLTDVEQHRQLEKEILAVDMTAEEKLRAGDHASTIEIVSKAKSKAAPKAKAKEAASGSGGISQIIGETVGQVIKPATKDQATMASYKKAPSLPKISTGTSPMASPKPSPPPMPKSALGPPRSIHHHSQRKLRTCLWQSRVFHSKSFKAPPPMLTKATSPRAPPQKSAASAASSRPRCPGS